MSTRFCAAADSSGLSVIDPPKERLTVVIAEDSTLMATRLQLLLARDCEVLAVVANGSELVQAVGTHRPAVIVSDIDMPVMTGLEAARVILQEQPEARIVFVTALLDPAIIRAALSLGALGFVGKRDAGRELMTAVHSSVEGKIYVSHSGWNSFGQTVGQRPDWDGGEQ
jgi:DNA-binding NarL/FixJ family response regulator